MKNSHAAVIIPAFHEEHLIGRVVADLKAALAKANVTAEIIVVSDGHGDNTAEEAKSAGATVISHVINYGQGAAVSTGLSYARKMKYTCVAMMDADGQHEPSDVVEGLRRIKNSGCDLLIGSRLIDRKSMSLLKRIGNNGMSFITFLLFGVHVTDSQSGMRVLSERAVKTISWKTSGYEFCSEMLWRAKQKGLVIGEYPIKTIYTNYSKSKDRAAGQNSWNGINLIKTLLRHRLSEILGE
jgi:UDP-N-acetylglucosamine---dolichyl-phosphate N-acetylglucosaminyltransferase